MNLVIFILACYGMTKILTVGHIFDSIRPAGKFWRCSLCMGFWVGLLAYIIFSASGVVLFANIWLGAFVYAFLSSGTSYLLSSLFDDFGLRIEGKENKGYRK